MKCHYDILGVDINCTADDLKKAYRKLALEWHPDKNLDRLEEAKETFQLIQQAYEILTDPQERAWYDRHRDDILRGGAEESYKDDCLNVYQYFNTSCFKGYNDEEKGFYTVYRDVFENITAEDRKFMDEGDEDIEIPQFGFSYSSYDEVHKFYAYWQSYCTFKSYSWFDKLDLCEARKSGVGRQVLRLMEKENKKLRDQHKRLRNEEVRELVAFVRKRDKRVQAHKKLMEELRTEKAKKAEELRKKQIQERNKSLENYKESEWASMSQFEHHLDEMETALNATFGNSSDASGDESENVLELYCAACEKDFRSEKAMKNHENSKKHKDNVLLLKQLMEEEESLQNGDEENNCDSEENTDINTNETVSSEALLDELIKNSTKTKKKRKKTKVEKSEKNVMNEDQQVTCETLENIDVKLNQTHLDNDVDNEDPCDSNTKSIVTDNETSESTAKSDITKKKNKKVKKTKNASASEIPSEATEKPSTLCEYCNKNFSTRNKLFDHLKETGHAIFKNDTGRNSSKKQRKKK